MFTDPEDAAEAPFSSVALQEILAFDTSDLGLLSAVVPPSPLPALGPIIVPREYPQDEPE